MVVYHSTVTGLNYKTYEEAMEAEKQYISALFIVVSVKQQRDKIKKTSKPYAEIIE